MTGVASDIQPHGFVPSPAISPERIPAIIPIRFWTEYKTEPGKSTPVEEDWVEWVKKGESGGATTAEAVKRLMPRNGRAGAIEWQIIGPSYDAWKKGNETPMHGTPLHAWSGVSREMADALKKVNILTIEDLAAFPDHQLAKIPIPHLREWRSRAKAWVEARGANDIGDRLAERDRMIEQQSTLISDMQEQMNAMNAALSDLKTKNVSAAKALNIEAVADEDMPQANAGENLIPADPPPRRRGRPPKE